MKPKVVTVVGARPQFIKSAPVSAALLGEATEVLVNTGQHYDYTMSDLLFEQLGLSSPAYNLGIGSGSHGDQTGRMLIELEKVLLHERPDWVLVYGDTNSTIAGALAAAKLRIPVAHVEAGLRSYNREMPEEINRIMTDHLAELLFAPTQTAVTNLENEGIRAGVHLVGDVMCDAVRMTLERSNTAQIRQAFGLADGKYYLLTVHRPVNADDPLALTSILQAAARLDHTVIFPVHPRTRARLDQMEIAQLLASPSIQLIEPVGYVEMLALEQGAKAVLTDSGGVQKEAFMLGTPCITIRNETEWVETVASGWNVLVRADVSSILDAVSRSAAKYGERPTSLYGDGHAAERITEILNSSSPQRHDRMCGRGQ